jgi:ligand-binding sensor domain-containing protein
MISVITEDKAGGLWIGGVLEGLNRYDPVSRKITHYGHILQPSGYTKRDTVSGFNEPVNNVALSAITSKDGLLWMGTQDGNLYNINLSAATISYNIIGGDANSFFEENDSVLWIATNKALKSQEKAG